MDPAEKLPQDGTNHPNVHVYRGPELIRKLKEVRGVASYSGHKNTPTHRMMQNVSSSVSKIRESDAMSDDPEQMKKIGKIAVIAVILVIIVLNI